jgi:hypothetical protein
LSDGVPPIMLHDLVGWLRFVPVQQKSASMRCC